MSAKRTVVVVGHGMVGHRFCEALWERDRGRSWQVVVFGEEPRAAYDRVGLTQFFAHRDATRLGLATPELYHEWGMELRVGERVTRIDRERQQVETERGHSVDWDVLVLATGSFPFVPPIPGTELTGVFLYRTIDDLERILAYGERCRRAVVIGGGLLGLEAAKAVYDLGLETYVVEAAPRLMPRQLDQAGARLLQEKIVALGVHVLLNKVTQAITGVRQVAAVEFADGTELGTDMVLFSCGIRPRDELARAAGLTVGPQGGVVVDNYLRTSDPRVYAIGEVALHAGKIYGLVAPGYEMAEVVAANLCGERREFVGGPLAAKLKLLGVEVASFGCTDADGDGRAIVYEDPFAGVYRKLVFDREGKRLLGGILVGDASDYATLVALSRCGAPLPAPPSALVRGAQQSAQPGRGGAALDDAATVCSCHNVSKGAICAAIRQQQLTSLAEVKRATRASTGCGGCAAAVQEILEAELAAGGAPRRKQLCEHFPYSRQELLHIVKVKGYRRFEQLLRSHGRGAGCEVCKPAVASILASLWNEHILDHATIQDTNDRFLANLQRGGLYSVVPRVPAGEITPEKLIVLGQVAKKYGLYAKITGGQRIDLFGAELHQLPDIWEELVAAGFESGHAYGKAMRTVKSCVGSSWCRFGVRDSVGFAIRVELRYRGIRAPHKIKAAVSGCIRECAEAQGKDFGLIATEKGWNLYVCGNGGAKPRHADLLAADLDEETAIRYIDRFLMYYIHTADPLTRTSVWLEKLEGGIEQVRDVVVHDRLGIAADLEAQMQRLVESYRCEWTEVVCNPERRRWFRQFVNSQQSQPGIGLVEERGQKRPVDWPADATLPPPEQIQLSNGKTLAQVLNNGSRRWVRVGRVEDFPEDGAGVVLYGRTQIAVYRFATRGEWYATQNVCPHKRALVLARGLIGDHQGVPTVACPLHKKLFALTNGRCLSGEPLALATFPVEIRHGEVWLHLPPAELLDEALATERVALGRGNAAG
ncbi:MAG: nitrite reductase large subunit NirB [Candidatus Binatia bacterium]|nr:nitrite reductase large subunit NirB [Candidatus Binatia bacterium]